MNIGKIVNPCLCALVTISGIGLRVFAEKDICDTTILNHPACEVGDFDLSPSRGETRFIETRNYSSEAIGLANRCLKSKNYKRAIVILKSAVAAAPSNLQCSFLLADAYVQYGDDFKRQNDLKSAIEQYRAALKVFAPCQKAKQRLEELNVSP